MKSLNSIFDVCAYVHEEPNKVQRHVPIWATVYALIGIVWLLINWETVQKIINRKK